MPNWRIRHRVNSLQMPTMEAGTKFFSMSGKPATLSVTTPSTDSRTGDEAALDAIVSSMSNLPSGWTSPVSLDSPPTGVSVSTFNSELRVTEVDLYGYSLTGNLPTELGNLKKCTRFNTKNNNLSGTIPAEIGNMTSMEWLILSGNSDNPDDKWPPLPPSWYHPGKDDNEGNDFTGSMPSELGNLPNIEVIEISNTSLTGDIPSAIWGLTTLKMFCFHHNDAMGVTGTNPFSGQDDQFGVTVGSGIGNMSELLYAGISRTPAIGQIPSEMANCTKLQMYYISHGGDVNIDYAGYIGNHGSLPDMSGWTDIKHIILRGNTFTGDFPWEDLRNKSALNTLDLTYNKFTGSIPSDIGSFGWSSGFDLIGMGWNEFSGSIPDSLTDLNAMIQLNLDNIHWDDVGFTGSLPQTGWGDWNSVRNIRLNGNALEGNIPTALSTIEASGIKNFYGNKFVFADIVPSLEAGAKNTGGGFNYSPQQDFGSQSNYDSGTSTIDFSSIVTHADNVYQWKRNGSNISESTATLDVSGYNAGDTFVLEVTNTTESSLGSGMTLSSVTITI